MLYLCLVFCHFVIIKLFGEHNTLQALPKKSRLQKIFNKNTVKVSYSCIPNLASIINAHNNKILKDNGTSPQKPCNCWKKDLWPLNSEYQSNNIIYNAEVENISRNETKVYIGLTEYPFKQRYSNHMQSIRHEKYRNSTELSKYVWQLKKAGKEFKITWSINQRAQAYSNINKAMQPLPNQKILYYQHQQTQHFQ